MSADNDDPKLKGSAATDWTATCGACGVSTTLDGEPADDTLLTCNACGEECHLPRDEAWRHAESPTRPLYLVSASQGFFQPPAFGALFTELERALEHARGMRSSDPDHRCWNVVELVLDGDVVGFRESRIIDAQNPTRTKEFVFPEAP